MINLILLIFLLFCSSFLIFWLLRLVHGVLVKDIYIKYIIFDGMVYWLYFSVFSIFWFLENRTTNIFGTKELIFMVLFIIILPIVYNTIKWYYLKNHPKLKTIYYPIIEFLIFVLWATCTASISEVIYWKIM